jgi:hypothetical protein
MPSQPSPIDRRHMRKFLKEELRAKMADMGFSEKGLFAKKLNDETVLLVQLQVLAGGRPLLGLFPQVGFMNVKVEEFIDRIWDSAEPSSKPRFTLRTALGYLMPDPLQNDWYFEGTEAAIRDTVQAVVSNVSVYGMPFMTSYPDLDALQAWARNPMAEPVAISLDPWVWRAAVLYLNGDLAKAKEIVAFNMAQTSDDDLTHPYFRPTLRLGELLGVSRRDRH